MEKENIDEQLKSLHEYLKTRDRNYITKYILELEYKIRAGI